MANSFLEYFDKRQAREHQTKLAEMQDLTTQRGQNIHGRSVDIQAAAQRAQEEQFAKQLEQQKAVQDFLQASKGQEGIASGHLQPSSPALNVDVAVENPDGTPGQSLDSMKTAPTGVNYGGQQLEAVSLLDQIRAKAQLGEELNKEHEQNVIKSYDEIAATNPEFASPTLRKQVLAHKLFGMPIKEESFSELQAASLREQNSAVEEVMKMMSEGVKDPEKYTAAVRRLKASQALNASVDARTKLNHVAAMGSPMAQFQLSAEQQATKLGQAAEAAARTKAGPSWETMDATQQKIMRDQAAQQIGFAPNSGYSGEAVQRTVGNANMPSPPKSDPMDEFIKPILEKAAARMREKANQKK